jgi:putative tricarboxylic transport membrane protein
MGKSDRISGSFWLLFSLFISYESYRLGLGTLHQPGPGFLFFWTGLIVASLAFFIILMSLRQPSPHEAKEQAFKRSNVRKVLLVLISLFAYALFMEWLGFFSFSFWV